MKKGMISANAVTCMRIVATAALIFTEPLSECFFCFYTFTTPHQNLFHTSNIYVKKQIIDLFFILHPTLYFDYLQMAYFKK